MESHLHQVELTEPELRALQLFRSYFFPHAPGVSSGFIGIWLLRLALAHPQEVAGWFEALCSYSEAEGTDPACHLQRQIARHPAYRKAPRRSRPKKG